MKKVKHLKEVVLRKAAAGLEQPPSVLAHIHAMQMNTVLRTLIVEMAIHAGLDTRHYVV